MGLWDEEEAFMIKCAKIIASIIFILILYIEFVNPFVHVWQQAKKGEAETARAEYNRTIKTLEAVATKESSKALSEAEIIRAHGVAEANRIIGASLNDNEGYLRYLYINHLSDTNDKTVIYIPTEGGIPILESKRLK